MKIYLVGGAVRDTLLGYPFHERDWVVVGAKESELLEKSFKPVGKDFPVFLHPDTKEEYALARKERKVSHGYAGFNFDTNTHVTLEDDLSRRDLTINAIAQDEDGNFIDPFNGRTDIESRVLRHVSPAFNEDPVRILRVARFAARYHHLGFAVADDTTARMQAMVADGEVDHLVAERVWKEMHSALAEKSPHIFFETLKSCGALKVLMPELDALFGVPQPPAHHPEIDTGVHVLMALQCATELSDQPCIRFAALMHDLGKGLTPKAAWPKHHGHETSGLPALKNACERLKVPTEFRLLSELVMEYHTHCHRAFELKPSTLLKLLKCADVFRRPGRFVAFLECCKADARGRIGFEQHNYPQANYLKNAMQIARSVTVQKFVHQGLKGKAIGEALDNARVDALRSLTQAIKITQAFTPAD